MNPEKVLRQIVQGRKGIRFSDFIRLIEAFGFTLDRVSGSYHIFKKEGIEEKDYYISIFYSEEDEAYVADIPDLKYCSAVGETPEQALQEVLQAKETWIASAKASNKPIPSAKFKPVHYQV